ncbi:MAG: tripartite tricarboxylate transporter substrate binding protein [Hyphomicrobiales bacterium]|nr:tripartite tricarboxylate transporter substrate binding protein [Alphaproteobacteria bacterium]
MRAISTIVTSALLAGLVVSAAHAQQTYPSRPVTLTHGFAAGGNADVVSRIAGEALSRHLGQPVVIEPRPGAGGNTASQRLTSSPPDGYTLITLTSAHAVSAGIYKTLPFDPVESFQFISNIGFQALIVAVRADSPYKTMADLIAAAKRDPGKLTYSSVGVGSTQHLAGELLCAMAGIKMTHIPYRGGSGPMTDLLGGQIDVNVDTITVIEPQVSAGKVTALGVTSGNPWWSLPGITPVSATVPGYDVKTWVSLAAPKGTPADVVKKLNADTRAGLAEKDIKEKLNKIGVDVQPGTPDEMKALVTEQVAKWKKVVADAGIPQQ